MSSEFALSRRTHSLFWKEWREKRWILVLLISGMLAVVGVGWALWMGAGRVSTENLLLFWLWPSYLIVSVFLGTVCLSRIEFYSAGCWLYAIPPSRAGIASRKIATLSLLFLPILIASAALAFVLHHPPRFIVVASLSGFLPLFLSAILSVHIRPTVVAVLVTLYISCHLLLYWIYGFAGWERGDFRDWGEVAASTVFLAGLLAGWFVFFLSRTCVQELGPLPRAGCALLFCAVVAEIGFTLYLADVSHLTFLMFGV